MTEGERGAAVPRCRITMMCAKILVQSSSGGER